MDEGGKGHDSAVVIKRPDNYDSEKENALRAEEAKRQAEMVPQIEAEIEAMIERDKLDPRQQYYLKNIVTGRLIRTNHDYHRAQENRQPLRQITYNQAYDLYRQEEAAKKKAMGEQLKKKRAKQARKKNRPR